MTAPDKLHHNLIQIPAGKESVNAVGERHEIVLFFDCENPTRTVIRTPATCPAYSRIR